MPAKILDGKALAATLRAAVKNSVAALAARGVQPGLAAVLVGDDPASRVYVRNKVRACEEAGILPAISPAKDVDGFHAVNLGALVQGRPGFVPGTPSGVMRLIDHAAVPVAGRKAVIVGRSTIVGKPLALLLLQKDATVTICHSKTADLASITRQADILVAAVGKAGMITAPMVKPGACVIDVGINRLPDGKLVGDVDFAAVKDVAGAITPVPGGVGPMTVAMLMANTVRAAELALG
jgi:methylenetetrahydrofolate dehydrogenase (NADP+)/methenyltetrahydrofolate cyclohydrolase